MKGLDMTARVLIMLGALNCGFIGVFKMDLVFSFFEHPGVVRFIYLLIGAAALLKLIYWIAGRHGLHHIEK